MVLISTRVKLYIKKRYDHELLRKLPDYGSLIRIVGYIKLKTAGGWSETYRALIDTGAHTSVIPFYIWKNSEHIILAPYVMRGLVPNEECKTKIDVGKLRCVLLDEDRNLTREMEIRAFLAPVDNIPLIIGFKDLLENFKLSINVKEGECYLENRA